MFSSCIFCNLPTIVTQRFNSSIIRKWFTNRVNQRHEYDSLNKVDAYHLTEEQLAQYQKVFKEFDKNADGKIVAGELAAVMASMGRRVTKEEAELMIKQADKDGSGAIEFDEFVHLIASGTSAEKDENAIKLFSIFDKDDNGFITTAELYEAMLSLNLHVSKEDVRRMMSEADRNGDGQISKSEFMLVWQHWISKPPKRQSDSDG